MAIVFDSDAGTITGISVGGLPDGVVDAGTLATNAVTAAKLTTDSVTAAKIAANSVDSAELVDGAVDDSHMASISGRRNIIINGAMNFWQRATSFSVSDNIYTADRFLTEFSGLGAFTISRSTDAPNGFGYSYKIDCTTADASPSAGDMLQIFNLIEGYDAQGVKKGTSDARTLTLSMWVKSNKTGNMQVNLRDANSRMCGGTYTINSADTWEYKTITYAADTSGAIANDNTTELRLEMPVGSGSTWNSGSVPTAWETTANGDRNAGGTINLADSTSNYLNITGIQLELGSTATDFEYRSYGEELALCQRYYQILVDGGADKAIGVGFYWSSNEVDYTHRFVTDMRASPTLEQVIGTDYYRVSANNDSFNGFSGIQYTSTRSCNMYISSNVSGTAGFASDIRSRNAASFIAFTAEL